MLYIARLVIYTAFPFLSALIRLSMLLNELNCFGSLTGVWSSLDPLSSSAAYSTSSLESGSQEFWYPFHQYKSRLYPTAISNGNSNYWDIMVVLILE